MKDYDFKFTKLSQYAPSLEANPNDLIYRFMISVSEFEEEFRMKMLVDDMDITQQMVFSLQIEDLILRKERKGVRMECEGSDGHSHSKSRHKSFVQGYDSTPTNEKSNEQSQPTCPRVGNKHEGRCFTDR